MYLKFAVVAVVSYLLGSFNFAIIVSKTMLGVDIRNYGSKNAGMTNALRTMGGKKTLIVIFGDVAKGALAVLAAHLLFQSAGVETLAHAKLVAAIFAVAGHIFPVYFHFKGGKGVLTSAAVMLFFDWRILLFLVLVFFAVYMLTKYVSLSSMSAAVCLPFLMYYFYRDIPITLIGVLITAGLIIMHRSNIKRLLTGAETKTYFFRKKETDSQEASTK